MGVWRDSLHSHIIEIMKEYDTSYSVHWYDDEMIWKKASSELRFSQKEVRMMLWGKEQDNRFLHYVLRNIKDIEPILSYLTDTLKRLEEHLDRKLPVEITYSFPKMASYSTTKKKILLNAIKLKDFVATCSSHLSQGEVVTFLLLHEVGHFLQDEERDLGHRGYEKLSEAMKISNEERYLLTMLKEHIVEIEEDAWKRGCAFLFLFSYKQEKYEMFSREMVSSYKDPSLQFLKEKMYLFAPK